MSTFATSPQICKRSCSEVYATVFKDKFFFKLFPNLNRTNGSNFNNNIVSTNFTKALTAQPIPSAIVSRVCSAFVFCKANVKWSGIGRFPNINVHRVVSINSDTGSIP